MEWTFIHYWQSIFNDTTIKGDIGPSTLNDPSIYLRKQLDNLLVLENLS